eukprot:GFKZ01001764.1.p1 GENE.GFKZ01001764.1~~GFKZ01001764.1.p1  ORF type:complete len:800 (-),score=119.57 GFKZ01001764.1:2043-4442(-)
MDNADTTDADAQTTALIYNVAIGTAITLVSFLIFDLLRKHVPSVYEARRTLNARYSSPDYFNNRVSYPGSPSYRFLRWVGPVLRIDLDNLIDSHGLDTALYLRYLRSMTTLFLILTIPSTALLIVYFTASNKDLPSSDIRRTLGVNKFSIANLDRDDPWRFWFTYAIELLNIAIIAYILSVEFRYYSSVRRRYRSSRNPANYAILVQDIPNTSFSDHAVHHYWNKLFPNQIARVYLIYDARKLLANKQKFWNAVTKRERAEWEMEFNPKLNGDRPTHKNGCCACCSPAVDSIQFWSDRQQHYTSKITLHQNDLDPKYTPPTRAAVVVFNTRMAASVAAQTHFASKEREWRVTRAPEPNAINWNGLAVPDWQLPIRNAATVFAAILLTLFWIIPVTFIMSLTNISSLAAIEINGDRPFEFLEGVAGWPSAVLGLIEGLLPAIILSVFLSLVPTFLRIFVNLSRVSSNATVDRLVRNYYFNFLIFSNFLFVAFAGTLLTDLQTIIQEPPEVVNLLAKALPQQGAFIMNFVLLKALSESPQEIMQLPRVIVRYIMRKFLAKTPREIENVDTGNTVFVYLRYYSIGQLIALLGMIYSTIQPFINVICLAYFSVNYVVAKYNLCYSMHNPYEDGGRMFGGALYGLWTGMFLHQLTMIGLFGLNRNPAQSALIVVPAVLSVLFLRYCRVSFDRVVEHGSGIETQRLIEDEGEDDMIDDSLAKKYIHPGFDPLPEHIENMNGVGGNDGKKKYADFEDPDVENPPAAGDGFDGPEGRPGKTPKSMSSEDWKDAYAAAPDDDVNDAPP